MHLSLQRCTDGSSRCVSAAAGLSTYGIVLMYFRRQIWDAPALEDDIDPSTLLRDK